MRTFIPPTSFVSSPDTEKERLLYQTAGIASGFYPRHGYVVVEEPTKQYSKLEIVIPKVVSIFDARYWSEASKAGQTMPIKITNYMRESTNNIKLECADINVIEGLKKNWKEKETRFWESLQIYFPLEIKYVKSLEIRITKIGSLGSHYLLSKMNNQHLVINIREDNNVEGIAGLIILSLIWPLESELGLNFTKRQTLRNFIMSRKEMRKIFPNWKPLRFENVKIPKTIRDKSEKYIEYLKIPRIIDPIKVINKNIDIFGVKESMIVQSLIKNQGEILTYDEIADIIWGEGQFKSYWAINKIVQRIQKKINKLDINLKIVGVRGVGYKI